MNGPSIVNSVTFEFMKTFGPSVTDPVALMDDIEDPKNAS